MPMSVNDVLQVIQTEGYWGGKYVRLSGKGYVFGHTFDDHIGLAEGDASQVESAAYLRVNQRNFRVEGYSMTTKKAWDEKDIENFQTMFKVPPEE